MRVIYQYTKCVHEDLADMATWLQNRLSLRDWTIKLETGDLPDWVGPPDQESDTDLGCTTVDPNTLICRVWVGIQICKKENRNARQILAHELLHCLFEADGVRDDTHCTITVQDKLAYTLDSLLYERYCQAKRIRLGKPLE